MRAFAYYLLLGVTAFLLGTAVFHALNAKAHSAPLAQFRWMWHVKPHVVDEIHPLDAWVVHVVITRYAPNGQPSTSGYTLMNVAFHAKEDCEKVIASPEFRSWTTKSLLDSDSDSLVIECKQLQDLLSRKD